VRLLGLAERLRETVGASRESVDRIHFAQHMEAARAALSEADFTLAWEYGRASSLDGLPVDPLAEERAHQPAAASAPPLGALTQREHEVAVLVAHGMTNRQVAEALVIAEGTARIHVERILAKLGFSSRRQLTSWAIEQGLLTIRPR
jgi:non-specific serine/threonine protein kinase